MKVSNKGKIRFQQDGRYSPDNLDSIARLSEAFRVLGDSTKLRICMLLSERELPVSEVASRLGLTDSAASHSLRILRNLRLVKYRREGRMIYYSLDDDHVKELIKVGYDHVLEELG